MIGGAAVSGAAGAAAAAAAVANAIRASGAIIKMDPAEFQKIAYRCEKPLVVTARGGWMNRKYRYLTGYKGLIFYTESKTPLQFQTGVEFINAEKIWIPGQ
ncbi:MAG: hypothetical protein JSV44_05020 [Candidatus Zixiibacteriota bacterium]|nr:MAG: hypothetical protein JSV44_05020 [candidate division Zixibacteria bacterium]